MQHIFQITSINAEELQSLIRSTVSDAIAEWQNKRSESAKIPEFSTRREVGALLRISLPTVDDYIRRGMIPAVKIGGRIRIKRSDIDKAIIEIKSLRHKRK